MNDTQGSILFFFSPALLSLTVFCFVFDPFSVYTLHLVLFLLLLLKKACFGSGCLDSVELLAQQELGVDRQENR